MDILLLPGDPHGQLRFVISNQISPEDTARLSELTGNDLMALFRAGVSSTGSGLGLGIVAEFVQQAFGLGNSDQAVNERYVGAQIHEGWFYVWFHWPAARNAPSTGENNL